MRKRIEAAILAVSLVTLIGFCAQNASATDTTSQKVVISQIQVRDSLSPYNEVVEIYNNSPVAVDITNWCLLYATKDYLATESDWRKLACFVPDEVDMDIVLGGQSYARIVSKSFTPPYSKNFLAVFSSMLSNDAGHVRLVDGLGNEVDRVGWGSLAVNPEGSPAVMGTSGVIERKFDIDLDTLIDTNDNSVDFFDTSLDMCRNMMGLQDIVPVGYLFDESHDCSLAPDACNNIDGLQTVIPNDYATDGQGGCISLDICSNLDGVQLVLPKNYIIKDDGSCINDLLPLKITELLPNPVGNDAGSEFIEIFNPNTRVVDLTDYKLDIGLNDEKTLAFPEGSTIAPQAFGLFSNADLAFKLVNSSSRVKLLLSDDTVIDTTEAYLDPLPGVSWALINAAWQYTDQITPAAENLQQSVEAVDVTPVAARKTIIADTIAKPCASNQYRSPETNRCRSIVSDSTVTLTPCKTGQYRNEETNRCRSIASDVVNLVPCGEGEERNPATNRCRSVLGATTTPLAPCAEGEERNPDTNRCRKVVATMPTVGFAVQPVADTATGMVGWWAFGGVSLLALAYGGWEWRVEIVRLSRRLASFIHLSK